MPYPTPAEAEAQRYRDEAARIVALRATELERNAKRREAASKAEAGIAARLRKVAGLRMVAAELLAARPEGYPLPKWTEEVGAGGSSHHGPNL